MSEPTFSLGTRARVRGVPSLAEAVSALGGVAIAIGVLLITIDMRANGSSRAAITPLFVGLVVAGYLVLAFLPKETHPAAISAIVLGIPGTFGWALLPGAHSFDDVRPFLLLTILAWGLAYVLPHARGRSIFVAAAAVFLWLWILGEVAGTGAFSAAPIPSPPAHTLFSLESFAKARATVTLGDLDSNDPLYQLALGCSIGDGGQCDELYQRAPGGSDFQEFGATCGNTQPDSTHAGDCVDVETSPSGGTIPNISPLTPIAGATHDKSFDIGLVSVFFGVAYLAALFVLDRGGLRGLATAFAVPGFIALVTGTQSLGNAAHHAWVAGLLTFLAGLGIGLVGELTERRFTTWAGGFAVALGAVTVALDASHISHAFGAGNVKLAGPGLIVMSFGVGLIATAYVIAQLLRRPGAGGTLLPPPAWGEPPPWGASQPWGAPPPSAPGPTPTPESSWPPHP